MRPTIEWIDDAVVILERVKLRDWKKAIARSLREILAPWHPLPESAVSVKAKTNERCDAVGEGKAVVAQVAVLLSDAPPGGAGRPAAGGA